MIMSDIFEDKVTQQMERLSLGSLQEIEREVAKKRIAWCCQNLPAAGFPSPVTPRQAFESLFFDYMGLSPEELPIVRESPAEIAWMSRNPCPTLYACLKLGLDTRHVCRAAYERSTQAFISQLDPQLRFMRSYQEIRPHADHCLEWILRVDFARMMDLAVEEALAGKEEGCTPGGAVMLLGKDVLGFAHDTTVTPDGGANLHAESHVIFQAVQTAGDSNLSGAILFATREPCAECTNLALRANVSTIVYGVPVLRSSASEIIAAREVLARSPAVVELVGGVQVDRCSMLYYD